MNPNTLSPITKTQGNAHPSGAHPAASFDPWMIWHTFRRCWYWASPVGLLLAGAACFLVYKLFVPEYSATHILESSKDYIVFQNVLARPEDISSSESQLIRNSLVLDPVLADPEVCKAPSLVNPDDRATNLRKNLTVGNAGSRNLLAVSYKDSDPIAAAMVCNAIVKSYLRQRQSFDDKRISDLEGWLEPTLATWREESKRLQERIKALSIQVRGFDPSIKVSLIENDASHLSELRNQITELLVDEAVLEAEFETSQAETPDTYQPTVLDPVLLESQIASDPVVARLRNQIADKEEIIRSMDRNGTAKMKKGVYDGFVAEAKTLGMELAKAEESAKLSVSAKVFDLMKSQYAENAKRQAEEKKNEIRQLKNRRKTLEESYATEKTRLEGDRGQSTELHFLNQEYAQASDILAKLNERIASIRTERQKGSAIQSLAEARPPTTPIEEVPYKKMLMAGAVAFFVPFGLGLLWELKERRITSAESVESRKLPPVIGEIARVPRGAIGGRQHRIFEESIETFRTNLLLTQRVDSFRTIAIASSMSGEGKSSLASQLAVSLAKASGELVLLIDADVRNPDQHNLFGLEMGPGLTKVLQGEATLGEAIDTSLGYLLHVLPAGRLDSNPHRLFSRDAMNRLLTQAKEKYRYVVIDTAPVLAAGETMAIASMADATLLCLMRDVSKSDNVNRCLRRLEGAGARVCGTVFSGVSPSQYNYRYGHYGYSLPTSISRN